MFSRGELKEAAPQELGRKVAHISIEVIGQCPLRNPLGVHCWNMGYELFSPFMTNVRAVKVVFLEEHLLD